jgi:hypothetical protein
MTSVGFEPTPTKTTALTLRLRPLGHDVDVKNRNVAHFVFSTKTLSPSVLWLFLQDSLGACCFLILQQYLVCQQFSVSFSNLCDQIISHFVETCFCFVPTSWPAVDGGVSGMNRPQQQEVWSMLGILPENIFNQVKLIIGSRVLLNYPNPNLPPVILSSILPTTMINYEPSSSKPAFWLLFSAASSSAPNATALSSRKSYSAGINSL